MPNSKNHGNSKGDISKRELASMDEEKQREIASKGSKASHSGGRNSNNSEDGRSSR